MPTPPPDPAPAARAGRVLAVVGDALDLAPPERAAFLAAACAEDAPLRAEVESLLRYQAGPDPFLASSAFDLDPELLRGAAPGELPAGARLGDCEIVSLLGEGGMGEVYLARDTALGRPVAVKLLKRHPGDEALGRRFRHERRVLAGLTHPGIARLYGAAITPEGRAYLVMEYVEGERLDRYCARRRLDVPDRLKLFRAVCAAVAYAHQNLVVHRDLKPGNILVTAAGEPKLLDFGIAKLLDPEDAGTGDASPPTLTLAGSMTPEYASPEQLRGEAVTTASDVYSLGVVLYELLTGQRPYRLKSRRPDELARAICEQEPPRPSTVVGTADPTTFTATAPGGLPLTDAAGAAGRESPARLRRRLAGDLDNIAAKALRKEPARRYGSVAALSEDLRRHGEGLPVSARADTLGYRADRFVRRNKAGVAAAALVVLALVGGLVATAWQARVAGQERDRARLAQRQAERLNGFLQTLLGSANPENGPGRDLKVVQVLDQASANLDRELAGEPALLAQAHLTIGRAYAGLREAEPAISHLRAALELDRRVYGEQDIVTARAKAGLGMALTDLARHYDEAGPLLLQALAAERRQPPAERTELPAILNCGSRLLSIANRFDEAKQLSAESLALVRQTDGEGSAAYADALVQMSNLLLSQSDYARAEPPLRQAIAILRQSRSQTPSFAGLLTRLAYLLLLEGKLDEPEGLLLESQELYRRTVGEGSIAYGMNLGCLAWLHFLREDYPRAEAEMRAANNIAKASLVPKGEQDYVGGAVLLAVAMTRNGKALAAEPILRENLDFARANHLEGNADPDYVAASLGECLLAQGRRADAEPLLLSGYAGLQTRLGAGSRHAAEARRHLHALYTAWDRPAEAARYLDSGGPSKAP